VHIYRERARAPDRAAKLPAVYIVKSRATYSL